MRPAAGGNALALPKRKTSFDNDPPAQASSTAGPPTAFFMASESMLDASRTPTASADNSVFGVRSLEEEGEPSRAGPSADESDHGSGRSNSEGKKRPTVKPPTAPTTHDDSTPTDSLGRHSPINPLGTSPPRALLRRHPHSDLLSQPLTPLSFASPLLGSSAPSSPKSLSTRSLRPSEDGSVDEKNSQAIASSDEEDEAEDAPDVETMPAPQLIMPSIMMPSRRPFTENGRRLGRLKVLLAGGSGTLPSLRPFS